jgi:hypothetical protein
VRARRPELPEAIDGVIGKAMAKDSDERYPTCAALTTAAEEALGLRRPPTFLRRRLPLIVAVGAFLIVTTTLAAAVVIRGARGSEATPVVKGNTLVRIDPATNTVRAVSSVGGARPMATAVGGRRVWVYNDSFPSVSEVDAASGAVLHTTKLAAFPTSPTPFSGPVLAADAGGAWLIGVDTRERSYLTRIFSGPRGAREFPLHGQPRAVAVGNGAVWVVVGDARDDQMLRIDPASGKVTKRTRFPLTARIDGIATGLGRVWVVASATATLYRINPRSGAQTQRIVLGLRAARPELVLGSIWVGLTDAGGDTVIVHSGSFENIENLGCCSPTRGYFTAGFGSIWTYDAPTGTVERWNGKTHDSVTNITLTDPPFYGGACLTSIAAGAGAVWVTATENTNYRC